AGLAESVRSQTVNVDTTPPASAVFLSGTTGANGWFVSNATVSLSAMDAMSGVDHITYRIDGGNWSTYGGSFLLANSQHLVEYLATDLAGITEVVRSLAVSVDTVPPTAVAALSGPPGSNDWFVSNVTVALNASDATSGVASLSYRVDGLGWTTYSGAFVLPDGRHLIEYLAADVAGLSGPIQSLVVAVDTTPPTTVAALSGQEGCHGWFVSNVTVFLNATDALSGLTNLSYRIDNGSWQTYSGPFLLAEGLHQVDFLAIDLAGNVEALQSLNVAI